MAATFVSAESQSAHSSIIRCKVSAGKHRCGWQEKLIPLKTAEDVARFARTIEATRTAKSHALNDRSSRSHCLVKIHLVRKTAGGPTKVTLLFVDLAGSERTKKTGVEGQAKAEVKPHC